MSDLISRQAAINAILHNQELYSNNFGNDPIDRYTIAIIDNDAQTIAQLPSTQTEHQWIQCSERLPKEGQGCLVCDHGIISIDTFLGLGNPYNWKCYVKDYEAWMPLPEPYKGEE